MASKTLPETIGKLLRRRILRFLSDRGGSRKQTEQDSESPQEKAMAISVCASSTTFYFERVSLLLVRFAQ